MTKRLYTHIKLNSRACYNTRLSDHVGRTTHTTPDREQSDIPRTFRPAVSIDAVGHTAHAPSLPVAPTPRVNCQTPIQGAQEYNKAASGGEDDPPPHGAAWSPLSPSVAARLLPSRGRPAHAAYGGGGPEPRKGAPDGQRTEKAPDAQTRARRARYKPPWPRAASRAACTC